jgi:Kdo2-lipid IVA lauroyltransferase/acyltransferase
MDSQVKSDIANQLDASGTVRSAPRSSFPMPVARPSTPAKRVSFGLLLAELKMTLHYSAVIGISFLPRRLAYWLSRQLGRARYRKGRLAARPLVKELQDRLGAEQHEAEKEVLRVFELSAWRDLELWRAPRSSDSELEQLIEFRGLEHLDEALRRGNGAILCTGHLRGLITFFVALGRRGYKINAVRRNSLQVQGPIGRWLVKKRTLVANGNIKFFWMNASSLKAAVQVGNALRRNEIVVFLIDVRYGAETVPVDFLGEKKRFPSGHVMMSQAAGAPLIDFFIHHPDESARQIVEFESPFYPSGDLLLGVQHTISSLESHILRHPADWVWFSERELWKNGND